MPGSIGVSISCSVAGSAAAIAGSVTIRPLSVDGFAATIRRSVMSSPVATILAIPTSLSSDGMPFDCARSWYSPGARPLTVKVPSGRIGPPDDVEKPNPPVDITMM